MHTEKYYIEIALHKYIKPPIIYQILGSVVAGDLISQLIRSVRTIDKSMVTDFLIGYLDYLDHMDNYVEKEGNLIYLNDGEAYVIGDIHGDITTLSLLLDKGNIGAHLKKSGKLIFLGDYIDRGDYQVETILFLITLQLRFRDKVILLRGNHEPPEWLLPYPHDFPLHIRSRFQENWREIYKIFLEIFDKLPSACVTKSGIMMVHGGISVKKIPLKFYINPDRGMLTEILWNDPMNEEGYRPSYRGAGYLFGPDITIEFLRENDLSLIIRGHEPANGYHYRHGRRIITLFSRVGPPYMNRKASMIKINLEEKYRRGMEEIISISEDEVKEAISN